MRLHPEKDDVGGSDRGKIAAHCRAHLEFLTFADNAEPSLTHGGEMLPAREERHVGADLRQARADVPADRACPGDDNLH